MLSTQKRNAIKLKKWHVKERSHSAIFAASKRSLRRLIFYTCLSVILFRVGVPGQVHPPEQVTPWAGTPPGQVPPGRYPLGRYPPVRYTPSRYTPWAGTPPRQVLPRAGSPPVRYTPPGQVPPPPRSSACWEIWARSGQYASHWNAFLLMIETAFFILHGMGCMDFNDTVQTV